MGGAGGAGAGGAVPGARAGCSCGIEGDPGASAARWAGAALLLEIGTDQSDPITALAAQYHLRRLETVRDYAGHERVLILER